MNEIGLNGQTVYIVIIKNTNIVESVWTSYALAQAAITIHAKISVLPINFYMIIERIINVTIKPE